MKRDVMVVIGAGDMGMATVRRIGSGSHVLLADLPSAATDRFSAGNAAYGYAERGNQLRVQAEALKRGARGSRLNSVSPGAVSTRTSRPELEAPRGPARAMVDGAAVPRLGTTTTSPPSWPTCSDPTPVTSRAPTSSSTKVWSPPSRRGRRRGRQGRAAPASIPRRR